MYRFLFLSALMAVTLVVPSSNAWPVSAQDAVTLRVWDQFTGPEGEVVEAVYDAFEAANPGIAINREVIDDQQMRQTANVALASGTGPDVVYYAPGPSYAGVL